MLQMHVVHAHEGDCLLLESGDGDDPKFILVDGGPRDTYEPHLRSVLRSKVARNGGRLEAVVLSHVDADHVTGLLDLFVELRSSEDEGEDPLVTIREIWHNAFGDTVARGTDIVPRFRALMDTVAASRGLAGLELTALALSSIAQGARLEREARLHGVKRNPRWDGEPILADGSGARRLAGLSYRIVGPTQANLDELRAEWEAWLDEQETKIAAGELAAMSDKSVPNLSSIQMLVEAKDADGTKRRLLLTGDGRGDHLLSALEDAELLDDEGGIDVDVLKVPHHGSDRNATRAFFERVRARTYVISANGKHGNPDLPTMRLIVDAAHEQGRRIELVLTNRTSTLDDLEAERPPAEHGYRVKVRNPDRHFISVKIAR
jgi:hypothetical protein